MADMGLDNIVHNNAREPRHAMIFNSWINDCESDALRTRDQENEQHLLQKYKNIRFLDDEDNQTYMIAPDNFQFKGPTISNNQYILYGAAKMHKNSIMGTRCVYNV